MTALYMLLALPLALRVGAGTFTWFVGRGRRSPLARRPGDRTLILTTIVLLTSEMVLALATCVLLAGVWSAVMIAP
jgi:hypothetical protein